MLHVLAQGVTAEQAGPLGVDLDFPLSFWLRDSGGRWHAARPAGWHGAGPGAASTRSGCGSCHRCPSPRPGSRCWPAAGRPRSAPSCRSAGGPRRDRRRTIRGSTASPAARLTCRAARAGTSSAGKPGRSGCRAIPTPRPNSCSPPSAGRRPGASSWPRPGAGIPRTCPCWPSVRAARPTRSRSAGTTSTRPRRASAAAGSATGPCPAAPGAGRCGWPARRSPRRPGRRPGACRTCRTGSEPRGAGTTCCRCWPWGTDSRSG